MCFIQYAVQKNLILTIENEEKKKKNWIQYQLRTYSLFLYFFLWQNNKFTQFHTR